MCAADAAPDEGDGLTCAVLNKKLLAASDAAEILAVCKDHFSRLDGINIITALQQMAKLPGSRQQFRDPTFQALQRAAHEHIEEFAPWSLSMLAWSCARLALRDRPLF